MLTKFETKSNRVKGLSFHPHRPWILASLHSGVIQLWDYRMGTLIDRFDEHDGPVRGVDFHATQPLFASGGDDYRVKVWSHKLRRCLFTLLGHLDYIRTVQFHPECPWILSASDDQTLRIWNWQARTAVAVLTGHNHYVMCARFHPNGDENLLVSASLDQTVRVWDVSALRSKTVGAAGGIGGGMGMGMGGGYGGGGGGYGGGGGGPMSNFGPPQPPSSLDRGMGSNGSGADMFGGTEDACVKFVLEGHDRGVNWAAFHPTLPLIVSGADDRQVKLWRMNDTKAWEVDTLRGHVNNVSCVLFHPRSDAVVSDSEDKTVRVWDLSKRRPPATFRREHDRFWVLASHPRVDLLAAGHDSGMLVFKLARERPASAVHGNKIYYVRDRHLRCADISASDLSNSEASSSTSGAVVVANDNPLIAVRRPPNGGTYRSLSYNPAESAALLTYDDADGGGYELYPVPREGGAAGGGGGRSSAANNNDAAPEPRRGAGAGAVFVARNRFAVLDRESNSISIKNLRNETTKSVPSPLPYTDAIFYAGTGRLLLRGSGPLASESGGGGGSGSSSSSAPPPPPPTATGGPPGDRIVLFDVQQRAVIGDVGCPGGAKYAVWSPDGARVALLCKHAVVLADSKLGGAVTVHETIRVKSAAWDAGGNALLYSTLNHVKYALPEDGDGGVVRTLDAPLYLQAAQGRSLHCLDRDGKAVILEVDPSEYVFKTALAQKRFDVVLSLVRSGALCGQAVVSYLRSKGFPEVALHFAGDDARARFDLALECGSIEVALDAARQLDEPGTWRALGGEALRHGNVAVAEFAYQRVRDYGRLAFLYALVGNADRLAKTVKLAATRGDARSRWQFATYAGDAAERVRALEAAGLPALAAAAAASAGLEEDAARLAAEAGEAGARAAAAGARGARLSAPKVLQRGENWPLLSVSKGLFESLAAKAAAKGGGGGAAGAGGGAAAAAVSAAAAATAAAAGPPGKKGAFDLDEEEVDAGAWGDDDGDLDLGGGGGGGGGGGAGGGDDAADAAVDAAEGDDDDAGWEMEDLELPDVGSGRGGAAAGAGASSSSSSTTKAFVAPSPGVPVDARWLKAASASKLAAEHVAAGAPDAAMRLLNSQLGIVDFAPLKPYFLEIRAAAVAAAPGLPGCPAVRVALASSHDADDDAAPPRSPALPYHGLQPLEAKLRAMYKHVTEGKFTEGLRSADAILHLIPLTVVGSRREADELKELLSIAREYNIGLRCELARKAVAAAAAAGDDDQANKKRNAELAAYFTHARLQPAHLALALRSAMVLHYKLGCFASAAGFCRRLLELGGAPQKVVAQARQVLQACEQQQENGNLANAIADLEYDERNPFDLCSLTFTPIYRGSPFAEDPYTGARFQSSCEGQVSPVGGLAKIGAAATGLVSVCGGGGGGGGGRGM